MFEHPQRRRIVLMRHAEAEYVRPDGTVAPDTRLVPLTENGRDQAARQASALENVSFDRAICSGLPRTVETAEIVLGDRQGLTLNVMPELEEIHPGDGFRLDDRPPADQAEWIRRISNPWAEARQPTASFLGGETFGAFAERVVPAWESIIADRTWDCLLLVLHGAVNRLIFNHVLEILWQADACIEQDNGCINIIDVDHAPIRRALIRLVNHTHYNPSKDGISLTNMEQTAQRMAADIERSRS